MKTLTARRSVGSLILLLAIWPAAAWAQAAPSAPSLSTIMNNMVGVAHAGIGLLHGIAFLVGLGLFISGAWQMTKVAESGGRESWKKPMLTFLAAGLLFSLPAAIDTVSTSLSLMGANAGSNVLAVPVGGGPFASMSGAMNGVVALIELLGNIAFFRGLYDIKLIGEDRSKHGWGGALLLMVMGSIAINVVVFAHFMGNTFAPGFQLGL